MSKVVHIIGTGDDFPINSNSEKWGWNYEFLRSKRVNKLFAMDGINGLSKVISGEIDRKEIVQRINQLDIPFITPWKEKGILKSETFPIIEVYKRFGNCYFKSTLSYMVAYALLKGYTEVHFWNINFASFNQDFLERPSVEYWLGVLNGLRLNFVDHNPKTRLFGGRAVFGGQILYGYDLSLEKIKKRYSNRYGK